jgi:hypothetical protein
MLDAEQAELVREEVIFYEHDKARIWAGADRY